MSRVHLWDTGEIARELQAEAIDGYLAFRYLAVFVLLNVFRVYYDILWMGPPDLYSVFEGLGVIAIAAYGLWRVYLANGGPDGRDLPLRLVALGVPVTLKLSIAFEVAGRSLYLAYPTLASALSNENYEFAWRLSHVTGSLLFATIWYWRMTRWFKAVK